MHSDRSDTHYPHRLPFRFLRCEILQRVTVRHHVLITTLDDFAVLNQNGLIAVLLHRVHAVRHQNDRLGRILLDLREEVVALALERLITDGKHLVEHKNVALALMATENASRTCIPLE